MTSERLKISLDKLCESVSRLGEALKQDATNPLHLDGTIQRFEFTFEQCWKTLYHALAEEGVEARTPREAFQKAYQAGWITNEELWLKMITDRNETSHAYDESKAREIYSRIPSYEKAFESCHLFLKGHFQSKNSQPQEVLSPDKKK